MSAPRRRRACGFRRPGTAAADYAQILIEQYGPTGSLSNDPSRKKMFLAARKVGLADVQISEATRAELQSAFDHAAKKIL